MIANSDEGVFLSDIIMDDDAMTMAQLRHKADGSHLSDNIPVPKKEGRGIEPQDKRTMKAV
eukprot:2473546-Ditylum_brightwellii.AAC.1